MGWWWSSDASSASQDKRSTPYVEPPSGQSPSHVPARSPEVTKPELSRDEQAERELQTLLNEFSTSSPSSTSTPSSDQSQPRLPPSTATLITPDSLYPTSMSCRQAFDNAFYCQSPGGQFTNVYRYGTIKSCSDHWSAFWFCMRNRSYPQEEGKAKIRDFYRKRAIKYKVGPSSEDIWAVRTEPVVNPFLQDPDAVEDKFKGS
ncbi:MAG: hypothetical protein M1817_003729 [Caeruleum heppii]|nr:MAG: hypothetical protein M1817_003729 [Caeruleum heppii]